MKLPASVAFSSVYWYFVIRGALEALDHGCSQGSDMVWVCTGRGGLGVWGTGERVGD